MTIIRLPRRSSFARLTLRACIAFVAAVISFLVINISYSKAPRYNHVSHIDNTDPFYQRDNTIYVDPLIGTSGPGYDIQRY